ncbi:MAG: TraR/DksA C4-type zinc finger protein [Thermoleophilia bacterium]|nr:TraR/DksA C4-type zinc finger protein [Gaiellaceae bacterium]MDW8338653.1 TraR/DksA C4-type zinc finger protein [Thermoleophilia bacterium]
MTLDLEEARRRLEDERARLEAALATVNHEDALGAETGELATGPGDGLADHATDTFMRELDSGLEENAEHLLAEIEAALARIEDGTYGTCVVCGKPIPEERLAAVPYASLCLDDKRAQERG